MHSCARGMTCVAPARGRRHRYVRLQLGGGVPVVGRRHSCRPLVNLGAVWRVAGMHEGRSLFAYFVA